MQEGELGCWGHSGLHAAGTQDELAKRIVAPWLEVIIAGAVRQSQYHTALPCQQKLSRIVSVHDCTPGPSRAKDRQSMRHHLWFSSYVQCIEMNAVLTIPANAYMIGFRQGRTTLRATIRKSPKGMKG